jgi:hypothetical protein
VRVLAGSPSRVGSPVDCDLPLTTACPSALLDRIPSVGGRGGRPRHRPGTLYADRGYDFDKYRRLIAVAASSTASHVMAKSTDPASAGSEITS